MTLLFAGWNGQFASPFRRKKKLLKRRTSAILHSPPFRRWHENGRLNAAFCHHLKSIRRTCIEQFAEPRLAS